MKAVLRRLLRRLGFALLIASPFALTAFGVLWPLVIGNPTPKSASFEESPATITDFDASYRITADGKISVVENLTVDMQPEQHGIFRFIPIADPTDPHARLAPHFGRIEMDGEFVPDHTEYRNNRTVYVVRIGRENEFVTPGPHVYTIRYTLNDGGLIPASTGAGDFTTRSGTNPAAPASSFYYNIVGFWTMKITAAHVTIDLPGPAGQVQCSAGGPACHIDGAGTDHLTITTGALPAGNPVTVRADLQLPAPERHRVPWPIRYDRILGTSGPFVKFLMELTGFGVLLALLWTWLSNEKPPPSPVLYAPPDGLGPVQCAYIIDEYVTSHALQATLFYLADRKLIQLDSTGPDDWTITGIGTAEQWAAIDPVSRVVGKELGVDTAGQTFSLDGSGAAGSVLRDTISELQADCRSWSETERLMRNSWLERKAEGAPYFSACAGLFAFVIPFLPTLTGLPFVAFAIAGIGLLGTGVGTRRTKAGRKVWSRAAGFRRLLATPSSEDRFDYAARKDLFISYIPYAIAFGVADKWAEKYRIATAGEPPVPSWLPVSSTTVTTRAWAAGLYTAGGPTDFNTALSATIAAEEVMHHTPSGSGSSSSSSSSSGSGSGWSSDGGSWGGGGGGGGGTW